MSAPSPSDGRDESLAQQAIRVLLVEDDDDLMAEDLLRRAEGLSFHLDRVSTYTEALRHIKANRHDVYLIDYRLGARTGVDLIRKARSTKCKAPMIVFTGHGDRSIDVEAMEAGAADFVVKHRSSPELLERSIRYALERHRLQERLKRKARQQIRLKQQFLSHVSHELRSPLTVIYMLVTIMLDGLAGEISERQREHLSIALRNIEQLRDMIEDLLEVTRAEAGKLTVRPRVVAILELIRSTVEELSPKATSKRIDLRAEFPENIPPVYVDADRVRQILINLIDNAIKFTPDEGKITVRAQVSGQDSQFVIASVSDTGCGIKPENTKRIFRRLQQDADNIDASRRGLGLGLHICKELVSRHQGRIWVESEVGQGSTFHFTLPVFSLTRHISKAMARGYHLGDSLGLVSVRIFPRGEAPETTACKVPEKALQEVSRILEECIEPGKDILLPGMADQGSDEHFFILNSTSEVGMELLADQIRNKLRRAQHPQLHEIEWEVSSASIDAPDDLSKMKHERQVEEVGRRVAKLIEVAQAKECTSHGRQDPGCR